MRKKKFGLSVSIGALTGAAVISLGGCGSQGSGEATEYTFWTYTSVMSA